MYPLSDAMFGPLNQWYIAAWTSDVTRSPMQRCILDKPVVMYRKNGGEVVALDEHCAHRHFSLVDGKLLGDNLQCSYHGSTFAPNGQCVRIPSQEAIPPACHIRSYPLVERWQWLWIWPGDPAKCDETLIPDHDELDLGDPAFDGFPKSYYRLDARHMLMHDNFLDLPHIAFLHSNTIGNLEIAEAKLEHSRTERTLTTSSVVQNVQPQPYFRRLFDDEGLVDRSWTSTLYAPCLQFIHEDFYRPAMDLQQHGAC